MHNDDHRRRGRALGLISAAAIDRGIPMMRWSVVRGITSGIMDERSEPIAEENAVASALGSFMQTNGQHVFCLL